MFLLTYLFICPTNHSVIHNARLLECSLVSSDVEISEIKIEIAIVSAKMTHIC